jgi:hypothetical protein
MIDSFVRQYVSEKSKLEYLFRKKHPDDYMEIVKGVVRLLGDEMEFDIPDPERIHLIDDGDYQGSLIFVIGAKGYQPDTYWAVKIGYGSCSGCDTLEGIREYSDDVPTEEQVKDYMTLALHVVQGLKEIAANDSLER